MTHFDNSHSNSHSVLGIIETKEQIGKTFTTNVNTNEYHMYRQPPKSAAGGVAIYANNKLDASYATKCMFSSKRHQNFHIN